MAANQRLFPLFLISFLGYSQMLSGQAISTVDVSERSSYKRGSTLEMAWVGGTPTDKLNVELLRDTVVQQRIAENLINSQKFSWSIPMNIRPGDNYVVRVTKADSAEIISMTQPFIIKRKIPLLLKLIPLVAVGAVFVVVATGSENPTSDDLPTPIKPN